MELDNHILAVVEPALMPTEIKMEALAEDKGDTVDKQTKAIGAFEPFILCNGVQVKRVNIESFEIELSGRRRGSARAGLRADSSAAAASSRGSD